MRSYPSLSPPLKGKLVHCAPPVALEKLPCGYSTLSTGGGPEELAVDGTVWLALEVEDEDGGLVDVVDVDAFVVVELVVKPPVRRERAEGDGSAAKTLQT